MGHHTDEIGMNRSTRNAILLAIPALAIGLALLAKSRDDDPGDLVVVQMYQASPLVEIEGWSEKVRNELGCDPCRAFLETDDHGNEIKFLFNHDVSMTLFKSDVSSASIGKVSRTGAPFILVLHLSDAGIERIAEYRGPAETVLTVNEIDGEIVGMTTLWTSGDDYLVGRFADIEHAEGVAAKLGVPLRIVIEPTI